MWSGAGAKLHDEPILSITGAAYTSTKTSSKTKKRKEPKDAAPESAGGVRLVSCGADGRLVLFELRCDGGGLRLATAAQWQAKGGADGSGAKGLRVSEKAGLVRRQPQPPSVLRECGHG